MFRLLAEPIDEIALKTAMTHPRAGAFVSFEGWVRNHNEGHAVTQLEYEAYEALCLTEANQILAETREQFDILDAHCVHRTGSLAVGEMAVWVGVISEHRQAAFDASEFVINEIKSRLPIWKKETYENGDSGWINCQACASHTHAPALSESQYYSRQQLLKEVGLQGQEKLKNSRVLVVGAGGLGCAVLPYLATAGVGHITIVDDDVVDVTNLHRQVLYTTDDIGQPKAEKAAQRLKALNPLIEVIAHPERLTDENVVRLLGRQAVVLDCTDNFETKFLLNDTAVRLGVPLLQASIYQYEGEIQWVIPQQGSACLRCLWPEVPDPNCVGSCAEVGVLGAVPGVFGTLQAMETLKYLLGLPTPLLKETLVLDLQTLSQRRIIRASDPRCRVCATVQSLPQISEPPVIELSFAELNARNAIWVDIREVFEQEAQPVGLTGVISLPQSQIDFQNPPLEPELIYGLICRRGQRSYQLAQQFRAQGASNVYSLQGGMQSVLQSLSSR